MVTIGARVARGRGCVGVTVCSIEWLLMAFPPSGAVQKQKPPDGGLFELDQTAAPMGAA
jgi:hypothetical protein